MDLNWNISLLLVVFCLNSFICTHAFYGTCLIVSSECCVQMLKSVSNSSMIWGEQRHMVWDMVSDLNKLFLLHYFHFIYDCCRRFEKMFIWSCPPSPGDDYIFYCHPLNQKTPKAKRLCDWYKKVVDLSVKERTIHSYKVGAAES